MKSDRDLVKVARQHMEMEQSFAGFVPRGTGRSADRLPQTPPGGGENRDPGSQGVNSRVESDFGDRARQLALIAEEVAAC